MAATLPPHRHATLIAATTTSPTMRMICHDTRGKVAPCQSPTDELSSTGSNVDLPSCTAAHRGAALSVAGVHPPCLVRASIDYIERGVQIRKSRLPFAGADLLNLLSLADSDSNSRIGGGERSGFVVVEVELIVKVLVEREFSEQRL
uniref:Uncharacterized protein n=1 Tax=Coccolithus braarudii TaxID=221442 RepID=A0A7S0LQT9_9EUKA|mmetsp:Transcript_50753/g.108375  ORF Transcript_50753/g.108375 Transcript_50753/m.108375 type:complete len:147 (+) Transcript_50753:44-484(+)